MTRAGVHTYAARDGSVWRRGVMVTAWGWTVNLYVPIRGKLERGHFGFGARWKRHP